MCLLPFVVFVLFWVAADGRYVIRHDSVQMWEVWEAEALFWAGTESGGRWLFSHVYFSFRRRLPLFVVMGWLTLP